MNWTSSPTAVSTVVGPSHSTRTFHAHWAMFRGPSHPAGPCQGLARGSPLADASALIAGMTRTTGPLSCRPARFGQSNRAVSLLRLAVNSRA